MPSVLSFPKNHSTRGTGEVYRFQSADSLQQRYPAHTLRNGKLFSDNEGLLYLQGIPRVRVQMQEGNELVFGGRGKTRPFTVTLGEVISYALRVRAIADRTIDGGTPREVSEVGGHQHSRQDQLARLLEGYRERVPQKVTSKAKSTTKINRPSTASLEFCHTTLGMSLLVQIQRTRR